MRILARLAIDAQLHSQVMRVRDFIGGDDPGAQRTEGIDALAETENTGLHFAALDIARGDVVEDHVTADVAWRLLRREVLAALLQHHSQFQLVVQLLCQVLRKNHRFFMADDRVYVLEENNPGHDRMRKAGLGRFFMVLPKIARRVEEFLGNDRRSQSDSGKIVKERFTVATGCLIPALQREVQCIASSGEAGVSAFKERPHVGRNESIRQAIKRSFALVVAQMQSASRIEIDNLTAADISADA